MLLTLWIVDIVFLVAQADRIRLHRSSNIVDAVVQYAVIKFSDYI